MKTSNTAGFQLKSIIDCEIEQVVDDMLDRWSEAFASLKPERLAALYSTDSLLYGSTPLLNAGRSEIQSYFGSLSVTFEAHSQFSRTRCVQLAQNVLSVATLATFILDDNPPVEARVTMTLIKQEAQWQIASHHASLNMALVDAIPTIP